MLIGLRGANSNTFVFLKKMKGGEKGRYFALHT